MTDRLEFGELTCGDSRSGSAVIENPSFEDVPWRARVEPRELFELDTSDGSLAAHGELGLLVTATARVAMLRPGTEVAGVLRVDVGGSLPNHFDVPLHFRASGAWLDVPATLDFGLVSLGESATDMLRLSNTGDRSVRVSFALSGDPSLSLDAALLDLSPGATGGPTIRVSPASAGVIRGEARVSFAGPLCNEARPTANVVASVTGDSLLVSPTILDLGDVRCGDPLASGTISVKNRGSVAVPWSAALAEGGSSSFAIADDSDGLLAPGGSATVVVSERSTSRAPGLLSEELVVTLGDETRRILVARRAVGASLGRRL